MLGTKEELVEILRIDIAMVAISDAPPRSSEDDWRYVCNPHNVQV
jgi:hypothetical protein